MQPHCPNNNCEKGLVQSNWFARSPLQERQTRGNMLVMLLIALPWEYNEFQHAPPGKWGSGHMLPWWTLCPSWYQGICYHDGHYVQGDIRAYVTMDRKHRSRKQTVRLWKLLNNLIVQTTPWNTLVGHVCGTCLWDMIVRHVCGKCLLFERLTMFTCL